MIIIALIAAAAIVMLWPAARKPVTPIDFVVDEPVETKPRVPAYLQSVESLQTVQRRLSATDRLGEDQVEAINILTLALAAGSEA